MSATPSSVCGRREKSADSCRSKDRGDSILDGDLRTSYAAFLHFNKPHGSDCPALRVRRRVGVACFNRYQCDTFYGRKGAHSSYCHFFTSLAMQISELSKLAYLRAS